ncbi:MAG: universal stress protein [Acidimicrobiales bacterium]
MKTWTPGSASGGALACFVDAPAARPTPLAATALRDPNAAAVGTVGVGGAPNSVTSTIVIGVGEDVEDVVAQARQRAVTGRTRLVLVRGEPTRGRRPVPAGLEDRLAAAAAALRSAGVAADYTVRPGAPAEVLAATARERGADLIVIGSRPPRLGRRRIGRVARALDRHAPCPVVLVAGYGFWSRKRVRFGTAFGTRRTAAG